MLCAAVGTSCKTPATAAAPEIPCPRQAPEFWPELQRACGGVTMPRCKAVERWLGQMLNYCKPLG
jgi:hypothetical protein